jgi:hypothetical protein
MTGSKRFAAMRGSPKAFFGTGPYSIKTFAENSLQILTLDEFREVFGSEESCTIQPGRGAHPAPPNGPEPIAVI